ncbi:MAG: hypothetical protein M3680_25450 [Myxococcota bacterium]|nr:hypothetical protein [Myxococcota bacterium]
MLIARPARLARMCSLLVLAGVAAASPAVADDADKYKRKDAAQLAIVDALDKRAPTALDAYITGSVETVGLWFSTPSCRKRFSTARVKAGKDVRALVDCFAPLGVQQSGLLITYGPGVTLSLKLDVSDDKVTLTKLSSMTHDPAVADVFLKIFETHRLTGTAIIPLDGNARAELTGLPGGVGGFRVCVDKRGRVSSHQLFDVQQRGALAKAIAAAVRGWTFKPFEIRGTPIPVCTFAFVRASEHPPLPAGGTPPP